MKRDMTTGEVAKLLDVAARTVGKWVDSDRLKGYRLPGPGQHRRIRRGDLEAFVKEYGLPPLPEAK